MARNQSGGGFSKFLNFIGLVDDQQPNDNYGSEYSSGNYGRPNTYVPPRQRTGDDSRRGVNGGRKTHGFSHSGTSVAPCAER